MNLNFFIKFSFFLFLLLQINTVVANSISIKRFFFYNGKNYKSGDTVYGYKKYIKLVVGDPDAALFLCVVHGGSEIGNPEIPISGSSNTDINTIQLTKAIAKNFKNSTKKNAWMIINELNRNRMDPNTYTEDIGKRYTDEEARMAYLSFHSLLTAARIKFADYHLKGKGALFLDIHGHGHKYIKEQPYKSAINGELLMSNLIDQTEIGYGLSSYALTRNDDYLNKVADSSSILFLSKKHFKIPFSLLIRGSQSFGGLLEAEGVPSLPGNKLKYPEKNESLFGLNANGEAKGRPYFTGGYITRKYGTVKNGIITGFDDNISAIQLETPNLTIRKDLQVIEIAAKRFNNAIIKYLNIWYGYKF